MKKLKNLLKVFILSLFVVVAFNSCDKGDDPQPKETAYLVVKVNTADSNVGILKSSNSELDSIYCKQFDESGKLIESAESDFTPHVEGDDTIYIIKTSQNPKTKRVEIHNEEIHNESGDTTDNVYNIVVKEGDLIYSTNTDFYKGSELPNSIEVRNLRTEEYGLNSDGSIVYSYKYYESINLKEEFGLEVEEQHFTYKDSVKVNFEKVYIKTYYYFTENRGNYIDAIEIFEGASLEPICSINTNIPAGKLIVEMFYCNISDITYLNDNNSQEKGKNPNIDSQIDQIKGNITKRIKTTTLE